MCIVLVSLEEQNDEKNNKRKKKSTMTKNIIDRNKITTIPNNITNGSNSIPFH